MEYFDVPNLEGLGLGSLGQFKGIYRLPANFATTAILKEVSNGKDTMTGHWEMMGLKAVSYTHLDVYKRQILGYANDLNIKVDLLSFGLDDHYVTQGSLKELLHHEHLRFEDILEEGKQFIQ